MKKTSALFLSILLVSLLCFSLLPRERANSSERAELTVLTFNTFDAFFGPAREERMAALAEAILSLRPEPDLMVLVEAFAADHRELVVSGLKARGYPVRTAHYLKQQYGTGIFLISRFPLQTVEWTPYRVDGALYDPEHYAGKGVLHYRLETPWGPLELFASHPIARFKPLYDKEGQHQDRDRKTVDRLLEMERIARTMLAQTDPAARCRILAGDLNVSPDMWEYQYLLARTGLVDSFAELHPEDALRASTYSPQNTFVDMEWFRIDHILYENRPGEKGFWIRPKKSDIVLTQTLRLKNGKETNLSDHFGLLTVFEVVTEAEGVKMNPGFRPKAKGGQRSQQDLLPEGLRLTPDNYLAWQWWAVELLDRAERRYQRFCPLVIPAARTVMAGEVMAPVVIPLTRSERSALSLDLKKEKRKNSR